MTLGLRPRTVVLFLGDLLFFILSLWVSLYLRTFELPSGETFFAHLYPFSLLFIVWVFVFFVAGLYESRSIILARRAISAALLVSQVINMVITALFFFFVPIFGIAPKTLLAIYLIVSFFLVLLWRVLLYPQLTRPEPALVVGEGEEVEELVRALSQARFAPTRIAARITPGSTVSQEVFEAMEVHQARSIIADLTNPEILHAFPALVKLISVGVRFFDVSALYEEIFGRIPLSHIDDRWLARNVSKHAHTLYDSFKRLVDIVVAVPLSFIMLLLYPVFGLIIKLQDGGPVLYRQVRVGQNNKPFVMYKFRSMSGMDQGSEVLKSKHVVTPFGRLLRVSRLDEFPQVWNVLKGELSLIGPRPEFPALVEEYAKKIPYYNVRHLVKPGLSGWAQLYGEHAHHGVDLEITKNKLSYDFYYLKHRSLLLDVTIILKTIKKLLSQSGV
jgi:exopolysaccharide biosynthesis polyprenyl glycosylphosphotransferase